MRTAIGKFLAIVVLGLTTTIYGGLTLGGDHATEPDEAVPVEIRAAG